MANILKIKRSSVQGKIPELTDLELGELAINTNDGKLFLKRSSGLAEYIVEVGGNVGFEVKNQTGSTITKGTVVRFAGAVGSSGQLLVAPFTANNTYPSDYVMGVAEHDIPDGGNGFVIDHGKIRGLNTSAWASGTILYASATTAGAFTSTMPAAPNNKITVAAVINSHVSAGSIEVRVSLGSQLGKDELVELDNLQNGDTLSYNSTTGRFENVAAGSLSETDTLATVTARGNTTTTDIQLNSGASLALASGTSPKVLTSAVAPATLTVNTPTILDSWNATTYRSAKYTVQLTQGTKYRQQEIRVIHNGSTTTHNEFAIVELTPNTPIPVTFSTSITGGNVNLVASVTDASTTNVNILIEKTIFVV